MKKPALHNAPQKLAAVGAPSTVELTLGIYLLVFLHEKPACLLQIDDNAKFLACCPAMRKNGFRECVEKQPFLKKVQTCGCWFKVYRLRIIAFLKQGSPFSVQKPVLRSPLRPPLRIQKPVLRFPACVFGKACRCKMPMIALSELPVPLPSFQCRRGLFQRPPLANRKRPCQRGGAALAYCVLTTRNDA